MSRYIDADKLTESIPELHAEESEDCRYCELFDDKDLKKLIDRQPTADVRENVKGGWLDMERIEEAEANVITEWQQARCSVCGKWHTTPYMYFFTHDNYCPNCGADMRGGDA